MSLHKIEVPEADITTLTVDAIVNVANSTILGGCGVDEATHYAAGKELHHECLTLQGCATGQAKITSAYRLQTKHVIHAVNPAGHGGSAHEAELLAACYRNAMSIANEYRVRSITFPSISTGVYRFPLEKVCKIAFDTMLDSLEETAYLEKVIFRTYSAGNFSNYQREFKSRKELAGQN